VGRLAGRAKTYLLSHFRAVIISGRDYREAFQYFRPGFNLDTERKLRAEAGRPEQFSEALSRCSAWNGSAS